MLRAFRGRPMKRYGGYRDFVDRLSQPHRSRLRFLRAATMALLLFAPLIGTSTADAAAPAPGASGAHVYLLRGVLNIFSLGLDDIAAKLRQQGIAVTVANFVSWSSLADEAAAE